MDRRFLDFTDTLEWNLVERTSYQAPQTPTPYQNRLLARSWVIENSHVLLIGCRSDSARSYWVTAGWASQLLLFLPSTTSNFPAATQTRRTRLQLGLLTLCVFPKISPSWLLRVDFPYWLDDVSIEIWRYDGADLTVFERIDALEQQL
ncbi:hypothetical protein [Leptolyngbya sp. 7M]|uniref:hypothetical protein n=1 Tax=Leptolyngbya sp. 7M TaxID=2812896 RepID=UPI001B8B65AF|nr:hypothetical protein [Leptolyngbya sp. 7M]QYO62783.1 hypothetical protein JVX88_22510 [Leptolyngbya sp. 7M]